MPGTAQAGQDGAARIANEIDYQIEALASYVAEQLPLLAPGGMAWADDDLVQQWIVLEHTRRGGLDEEGDMALRIGATERPQHRRAEEHIADLAKLNDQNALCSKTRCQISRAMFHAVPHPQASVLAR